jgi:hypothetical protein
MTPEQPPARLLRAIRGPSRGGHLSPLQEQRRCDAYREILRDYRAIASRNGASGQRWHRVAAEALRHLGGDADRLGSRTFSFCKRATN